MTSREIARRTGLSRLVIETVLADELERGRVVRDAHDRYRLRVEAFDADVLHALRELQLVGRAGLAAHERAALAEPFSTGSPVNVEPRFRGEIAAGRMPENDERRRPGISQESRSA